jgi:hypothetical protein
MNKFSRLTQKAIERHTRWCNRGDDFTQFHTEMLSWNLQICACLMFKAERKLPGGDQEINLETEEEDEEASKLPPPSPALNYTLSLPQQTSSA